MVEQLTLNQRVAGSSPARLTTYLVLTKVVSPRFLCWQQDPCVGLWKRPAQISLSSHREIGIPQDCPNPVTIRSPRVASRRPFHQLDLVLDANVCD